jgi:hypothetical protein
VTLATATDERERGLELTLGTLVSALGAAAVIIGSFGPWARVAAGALEKSASGIDYYDGDITLVAGFAALVVIAFAAQRQAHHAFAYTLLVPSLVAIGTAVKNLVDILHRINETDFPSSVDAGLGWGILVCIAGGFIAVLGMLIRLRELDVEPEQEATT